MLIEIKIFLLIVFYVVGVLISIPLSITYSNNFSAFETKGLFYLSWFSWFSFIFLFLTVLSGFPYPIKTKNIFNKFFQFRFVKRNIDGFRISDEY
jgi:hypothetical protein